MQQQTTNPHQPQQYNISELALRLNCFDEEAFATLAGVKRSTLGAWRKRGQGPEYILLGCNYLYPIPSIQSHLARLIRIRTNVDPKSILIN